MVYNKQDIEEYKKLVVDKFMIKSLGDLVKEFETDRLCWAFVMWTYKHLNIFIDTEKRLRVLFKNFRMLRDVDLPYRFPDIIIFKYGGSFLLGRHAGIMLDRKRFVHLGIDEIGLQFTDLTRLPWNSLDKVVIRQK